MRRRTRASSKKEFLSALHEALYLSEIITCTQGVRMGIPVPALSASLSYFDSYRTAVLPANLIQAERDYFGALTYHRVDKEGIFHTEWKMKEKQGK